MNPPADPLPLYLGGGVVRLSPGAVAAPRAAELAPFTTPPSEPPDFAVDVALSIGSPAGHAPPFAADFTYTRFDLAFAATADRRRADAVFDGHPDGLLAVLELAVAAALAPRGGLLIHAAGVVIDGEAWLLPGPSGTGKSTAARAPDLRRVLSDERIIARRHRDRWRAWGTPWWSAGRTRPLDPGYADIGGLARITKATAAAARPLPEDAAAAWLLGSVALYEEGAAARRAAFEAACDLASGVRCVALDLPREGPWSRSITPV